MLIGYTCFDELVSKPTHRSYTVYVATTRLLLLGTGQIGIRMERPFGNEASRKVPSEWER